MANSGTALITAALLVLALVFTGCPNAAGGNKPPPPAPPSVNKFKVTLETTIGGNVTVSPALPEDGMVAENTEPTFTAALLIGYKFVKWQCNGTNESTEAEYKL